jgi:sterol desaturase/sphingolipid hydroxylase (fatty acid hydroxylase superfamily)
MVCLEIAKLGFDVKNMIPCILSIAISFAFLFSLALPYVPITARLFSFTPLPLQELGITLALTVIYVFALDVVKVWYHRLTTQIQKPAQTK